MPRPRKVIPFEIYKENSEKNKRAQFRWRTKAANGNILAMSSEGYNNKAECLQSAIATFYILQDVVREYETQVESLLDKQFKTEGE